MPTTMITVGVFTSPEECAVAIARDGRILSAAHSDCTRSSDLFTAIRAAVAEAVDLAEVQAETVRDLIVAAAPQSDSLAPRAEAAARAAGIVPERTQTVCAHRAAAAQLRGHGGNGVVLSLDDVTGEAALFAKHGTTLTNGTPVPQAHALMQGAALVADALKTTNVHSIDALEEIASIRPHRITNAPADAGPFDVDTARALVTGALAGCPQLGDAASVHVGVQAARAALAATALNAIAATCATTMQTGAGISSELFGVSGPAFTSPAFVERVAQRLSSPVTTAVPEAIGAALGAALLPWDLVEPLRSIAYGRATSEQEIKNTLENCRLDYVYEPDWLKLLARVSTLLSTGALVGWFQGRRDFGARSFGSRSVLADPSHRYVRDNVNVFLLRRDVHAPLPVSILSRPGRLSYDYVDSAPRDLVGAADRHGRILRHAVEDVAAPELARLLEIHRVRTGVSGLVNVPLADERGLVETARDAVRATFGCAIDVLVLGRFLVSKDYWLLRGR